MEDLYANENEISCFTENIVLTESHSYEDPVLVKDKRVLKNILERQDTDPALKMNYFETVQTEVKPHMRKIVSDWMLQVCEEQQCQPEVFSLAVNYMDRFLARVTIKTNQFQLLACACMFLASKFKETTPLPAENLVLYTENSVTTFEITQWELLVLDVIQWELSAVTPYSILDNLLRTLDFDEEISVDLLRRHAETFVALAATEHQFSQMSPALVAVSCLTEALRGLKSKYVSQFIQTLEEITGVQAIFIEDCMDQIAISIKMSMSGISFQPSNAPAVNPPQAASPKIIPQQPGFYESTTPTDIFEVSSTFVC